MYVHVCKTSLVTSKRTMALNDINEHVTMHMKSLPSELWPHKQWHLFTITHNILIYLVKVDCFWRNDSSTLKYYIQCHILFEVMQCYIYFSISHILPKKYQIGCLDIINLHLVHSCNFYSLYVPWNAWKKWSHNLTSLGNGKIVVFARHRYTLYGLLNNF